MDTTDTTKRVQEIADTKYEGNIIKAQREVDFATETYSNPQYYKNQEIFKDL